MLEDHGVSDKSPVRKGLHLPPMSVQSVHQGRGYTRLLMTVFLQSGGRRDVDALRSSLLSPVWDPMEWSQPHSDEPSCSVKAFWEQACSEVCFFGDLKSSQVDGED